MALVMDIPSNSLPPHLAEIYETFATDYGPFRNQVAVLAHVPPVIEHLLPMLMALKARQGVPQRYIELAVVVVSKLNECEYCIGHHAPQLEVAGLSRAGIEQLLDYQDHEELDDADKAVIEYAIAVTKSPQHIRDRVFDALRQHFSESQIVELTVRIALCGFFNRFNDALMIETEAELAGA